jgi:hypothetical protein
MIDLESLEHINMDVPRTASVHRRFELAPGYSELDRGTPKDFPSRCWTGRDLGMSLLLRLRRRPHSSGTGRMAGHGTATSVTSSIWISTQ